jgi:hypothetical protein
MGSPAGNRAQNSSLNSSPAGPSYHGMPWIWAFEKGGAFGFEIDCFAIKLISKDA